MHGLLQHRLLSCDRDCRPNFRSEFVGVPHSLSDDIDSNSLAGRHACADIDYNALANRHADSCADVDVRAFVLHAPYHARCGLTGTHAEACTMTHTHHGTCARTGTPSGMNATELFTSAPGDGAGTAPIVVHIGAGTEADLRCD